MTKTAPPPRDALQAVKELHHVLYWFVRTYTPNLDRKQFVVQPFDEDIIPQQVTVDASVISKAMQGAKRIQELEKQLEEADQASRDTYQKTLNQNEAETRDYLIDALLHEAGWLLKDKRDREYPVAGMPISQANPNNNGFVDYVLWGDDGTSLAVVEAKRTNRRPEDGQQQAKLYAIV